MPLVKFVPMGSSGDQVGQRRVQKMVVYVTAVILAAGIQIVHADQADVDLSVRSPDIHWPTSPNPANADMFSHNEIVIAAPCTLVWNNLIDAERWPEWYPNAQDVHVSGDARTFHPNASFHWTTFDTPIESKVAEFVEGSRLAWFGRGKGVLAYHTWLLARVGSTCRVVTESAVAIGPSRKPLWAPQP